METNKISHIIGTFEGKCCDGDTINNNGMHLSRELFENLFASDEYKDAIERKHYIGFLGHPDDPACGDYRNACIVMTECHLEDNGDIVGKFDLVDTPVGRVVKTFIDAGVTFGISIRGAGDVGSDGEVDPDTFVFRGFDLVTFPAYNDAVPVFTEIAASSDLEAQKKLKKICASIDRELPNIESANALDVISECVTSKCDIKDKVDARKAELNDEIVDVTIIDEDEQKDILGDLDKEKIACMTDLYIEACTEIDDLKQKLNAASRQVRDIKASTARKVKALERMSNEQISSMDILVASTETEKSKLNKLNLRYNQKIERQASLISQKDSVIASLEAKLDETVTKLNTSMKKVSNLDTINKELKEEVKASTQLLEEYQDAYAYLYSRAVGVPSRNISINASTSVKELQKVICGTSTANVSSVFVEPQPVEIQEDISDAEDELVSL